MCYHKKMISKLLIGKGRKISCGDLAEVARKKKISISISSEALSAMKLSEKLISQYIEKHIPVYGLTTQFGNQAHLLDPHIRGKSDEEYHASLETRQLHLVASHNCGLGEEMPEEIVRGTMLLRAHCLAQGYSGIRTEIPEALIGFLKKGIQPVVRRYGSIGASGDLIPLSSVAASLMGLDTEVVYEGKRLPAKSAILKSGLEPICLSGREGLALINGTSFSTSMAALAMHDLKKLYPHMLRAIGFALESLRVMDSGYEPIVHKVKNHSGAIEVAKFMKKLWAGSKLVRNLEDLRRETYATNGNGHSESQKLLQDYYSLRSVAQGFGPMHENLEKASLWIEEEINSANDNPVIDVKNKKIHHASNFMGHYVTEACDLMKMDIAQASTWLHALLAVMVHPRKNYGLPANLVAHPEIDNGFRPLQILAASIAVQNRKLAQSQQAFMLPTEGDNQDVNSLSAHAAYDFRESVKNLERLSAILTMAAMQAMDLRGIEKAGNSAKKTHFAYRKKVAFMSVDRIMRDDIEKTIKIFREE